MRRVTTAEQTGGLAGEFPWGVARSSTGFAMQNEFTIKVVPGTTVSLGQGAVHKISAMICTEQNPTQRSDTTRENSKGRDSSLPGNLHGSAQS